MEEFINLTLLVAEGQDELSQIFSSTAVEVTSQESNIPNTSYNNISNNNNNSNNSCLLSTMARTILSALTDLLIYSSPQS